MIGINDTVPLGGIILTDPKPVTQHQHVQVSTENKIKNYDPYGLGLSEKELTYVTIENKLILIEVSTMYVFLMFLIIIVIIFIFPPPIISNPNIILSKDTFLKYIMYHILFNHIILYYIILHYIIFYKKRIILSLFAF